ncbi:AraC-like DNA-binding protein [Actinocorallia herbida]|uniref:AraC-like DNA-binding protein n=2 Tax=Actinocorallia herbida TaxID=58109 RepID=A0A3N1CYP1_9ACTN|nr:AraC-like DNA-binding protein [Actinocorallia herbida]
MTFILDTREVAPSDREEAIREVIWGSVVRVEIDHHRDPERIAAWGRIGDVAGVNICTIRSNATTIRRTPALVNDDLEPSVFVSLQRSGTSAVIQGDRQAILHAGDLAVYDTEQPYVLLNDGGIDLHYFRIRQRDLGLSPDAVAAVTAVRLGAGDPVAELAAGHLRRLAEAQGRLTVRQAQLLAPPTLDLLRAALTSVLGDDRASAQPWGAVLEARIFEFVRENLTDHGLTPARIAHAHGISLRRLYAVMAGAGVNLAPWIRDQRLAHARRLLIAPSADRLTIEAVARRSGFVSAAHFSRVFKTAYGLSPRDWRNDKLPGHRTPAAGRMTPPAR